MVLKTELFKQFNKSNRVWLSLAVLSSVLSAAINLSVSWLIKNIVDGISYADFNRIKECFLVSGLILCMCIIDGVIGCLAKPQYIRNAISKYREYVFGKILKKHQFVFQTEDSDIYLSSLTNDASMIEKKYLEPLANLIMDVLLFVGALIMMIIYSPLLTLIAVILFLLPMIISSIIGRQLQKADLSVSSNNAEFTGFVKNSLIGFDVIKAFQIEHIISSDFINANNKLEKSKAYSRRIQSAIMIVSGLGGIISQLGLFFVGAFMAYKNKTITAGTVIAFVQLMNYVIIPLSEMPEMISSRESAKALINKISNALNCHIYESKDSIREVNDCICISCANYSITPGKSILQNINIKLDMGKSYAIIGPSGSGKSTLLRLLTGGIPDIDGSILVDNHKLDLNKGENLISSTSYIQQEAYIFNTTIQNNITMFKSVEDKILNSVIRQACLQEVIEEKGLDYCCGDNGSNLSGGEKQRIAIARCLLRDKNIILADEITSAIDVVSADKIYNTILNLDNKLRVMVTHKIEAELLKRFDIIIVMNEGQIVAMGNYCSLNEKSDYFKELLHRGNICMENN